MIDIDATLTTAFSEKEGAAGNFKKGFGHHPLLCYLDDSGEALAGILRPGNAGSNTASDHKLVLDLALEQLDQRSLEGEILIRADGAGATHELCVYCREGNMRFSFGFDLSEPVLEAIVQVPESAWVKAIRKDASQREHSQVCEITERVEISSWPERSRLIARRTELKEGDQQSFADHDGYRLAVFITDQQSGDAPELDLDHRGHARVEDRIRQGKDCGLSNLPFKSFQHNQVWLWLVGLAQDLLAWTQQLCLIDDARRWELKRLRYRLLHQSARIARHARQRTLRLAGDWPWSGETRRRVRPPKSTPSPHRLTSVTETPSRRSPPASPPASACPKTGAHPAPRTPRAANRQPWHPRTPPAPADGRPNPRLTPNQTLTASEPDPRVNE